MKSPFAWLSELRSFLTEREKGGRRNQLVRGSTGSFLIKGAQTVLTLGLMVLLARLLGTEGYGVYAYVLALVEVVGIPAQTGIGTLTVREVAAYQEQRQWARLRGVLRFGALAIVVFGATTAAGVWGISQVLEPRWSREKALTVAAGAALLPLRALSNFRGAALRGLKRIVQGLLPENVLRPAGFLFLCAGVWFVPTEFSLTPSLAMLFHTSAAGIAFVAGSWMLERSMPEEAASGEYDYDLGGWLSSIGPLSLITGMQVINSRADIVMLGIFSSSAEVGVYRVAAQGGILVVFGLKAINTVVAPHFSSLWASQDMERLQKIVTGAARVGFGTAVPVALVLIVFGGEILELVFGVEFASGRLALAIICGGQLINAAVGSVVLLLNMTGHETVVVRGLMVAAVSNILLNLVLIPVWGMEGAAVATVATFGVWNLLLWRAGRSRLNVDTMAFTGPSDP